MLVAGCLLAGVAASLPQRGATNSPAPSRPDAALHAQGRFVYERNCLVCHGKWGEGNGEMSAGMRPKPRRFSAAVFKFRSTPSGVLPTDEDLARTIRQGISLSSMPAFATLSDREVQAVVEYVKSFSGKWRKPSNLAPPIPMPPPPAWLQEPAEVARHAVAGRALYDLSCIHCHGPSGDGHGDAAPTLEDAWEEPCPPTDLRQPYARSGGELKDLYRALVTGLDGTPMPSFQETTTEDQRWDLIAYIELLRRNHRASGGVP